MKSSNVKLLQALIDVGRYKSTSHQQGFDEYYYCYEDKSFNELFFFVVSLIIIDEGMADS